MSIHNKTPTVEVMVPWITVDLGGPHQVAGWPVIGSAFGVAQTVTWRQVCNSELPPTVEPSVFLQCQAQAIGRQVEVGFLTAADVRFPAIHQSKGAMAVVTAGLGNGESVFPTLSRACASGHRVGTINILAVSAVPLTVPAFLEAVSLVAEARTTAVLQRGLQTKDGRSVTGTGTDCIVVAAPLGASPKDYCGLHTRWGQALAEAAYLAAYEACFRWQPPESK